MSDAPNELDLMVCSMILTRPDEDRAAYEEELENISTVQDELRERGVDVDLTSQPGTEVWEGGIETIGALYQLARIVTRIERGSDIAEVLADGPVLSDELDPFVTDIWDELVSTRYPHLLNLQGINSYYLPTAFDEPIWLPYEEDDGSEDLAYFASSINLQRELADLGPRLLDAGVQTRSDAYRCFAALKDAADASVAYALPISVW